MSAIGTKRTWACALQMSAIGGKTDMPFCTANVRIHARRDTPDPSAQSAAANRPHARARKRLFKAKELTLRLLVAHTLIFSSASTRPTAGRFSIRSLNAL